MDTTTLSTTTTTLSSTLHSSSPHPIPSLPFKPKPPPLLLSPLISSSSSLPKPPKPKPQTSHPIPSVSPVSTHRRAATGYAAALADACLRANTLTRARQDSQRLLHDISALPAMVATASMNLETRLVALVGMLVRKGKTSVIPEVLVEFGRICDELLGTQTVVVVHSGDGDRVAHSAIENMAREVRKATGAARVRVRHVFATV